MPHTVFSIGNNRYQRWQAQLLAYSHRKVGQPGKLTCLVSGVEDQEPVIGADFFTPNYFPHPVTGDRYAAYNKPAALRAWLQEAPPHEETILLVDPDCVFLSALDHEVEPGRPVAQPIFYMNLRDRAQVVRPPTGHYPVIQKDWASVDELLETYCSCPDRVQGVGIPTLIHRDDLKALVPLWLAKTEQIRADHDLRDRIGWIAEMWAYSIAAAELGLHHEERDLACFATEARTDLPLVHYCYDVRNHEGDWTWGKRSYNPWTRVPDPPTDVPRSGQAVIRVLNAFVDSQHAGQGAEARNPDARRLMPETLRLGLASTMRGNATVIDSFITYHRAIGFDHLFLFFDDPDDPAIDRARRFEAVTIIRHDEQLRRQWEGSTLFAAGFVDEIMGRQTLNLEVAIRMARDQRLDWLLHIDQDELFFSEGHSVKDHFTDLTRRNVACAMYSNYEAIPEQIDVADYFREATLFKRARADVAFTLAQRDLLDRIPQLGPGFFHFYAGVKSAARVQPGLLPFGTHKFKPPAGSITVTATTDPIILHYPCCGFGHFWEKFTILGSRPYTWWGEDAAHRLGPFFHDALGIGRQGDREAARAFYEERFVIADAAQVASLLESGLCCRITMPAQILQERHSL